MEIATKKTSPLISARELLQQLTADNLVLLDARSGKNAFENYAAHHIQNALHIDLDKDLAEKPIDAAKGGRHPLPEVAKFATLLGSLGISPASHVVVYDDKNGANAAARCWWMLRSIGHEQVQVLDGGMQAAVMAGIPFDNTIPVPVPVAAYPAKGWNMPIASIEEVTKATVDPDTLIIDVRERYRYLGESEPIDLIAGHIPNAVNVPYLQNLASDGSFLSPQQLASDYRKLLGNHPTGRVIVHCGSGVTACHTLLALEQAGMSGAKLYVGSWGEWSRNDKPVATGE
ncbi:MAG: sulfurtransferase [Chitinophagales bacterium]|nr:sulfurtransferase [Chitinophagales bacterium]